MTDSQHNFRQGKLNLDWIKQEDELYQSNTYIVRFVNLSFYILLRTEWLPHLLLRLIS